MTHNKREYNLPFVIVFLALGMFPGTGAFALTTSIELTLHHAIMKSEIGAEGRVIATEPFSKFQWERTSLVVIDSVIFGKCAVGDTLEISWRSNRCDNPDGSYSEIACGGGCQLSDLEGKKMFWLFSGEESLKCQLYPLDPEKFSKDKLLELASFADGTHVPFPYAPIPYKDLDELESDPANSAKCEGVAGYLRNFKSSPGNSAQPSLEIIFVGLPGLKYPRAIGCESIKIGDIRVDCPQSYTCYESRPFPPGVVSSLKEKARELGGDIVQYFNGVSSGIDAQVYRRKNSDCKPILLFIENDEKDLSSRGCQYMILGRTITSPIKTTSTGSNYWETITGSFADSVRARDGEGLWVTESDGVMSGRVLLFLDEDCRGWFE